MTFPELVIGKTGAELQTLQPVGRQRFEQEQLGSYHQAVEEIINPTDAAYLADRKSVV